MSNSLDPDQVRCFVGLDLGLNCLQLSLGYLQTKQVGKELINGKNIQLLNSFVHKGKDKIGI